MYLLKASQAALLWALICSLFATLRTILWMQLHWTYLQLFWPRTLPFVEYRPVPEAWYVTHRLGRQCRATYYLLSLSGPYFVPQSDAESSRLFDIVATILPKRPGHLCLPWAQLVHKDHSWSDKFVAIPLRCHRFCNPFPVLSWVPCRDMDGQQCDPDSRTAPFGGEWDLWGETGLVHHQTPVPEIQYFDHAVHQDFVWNISQQAFAREQDYGVEKTLYCHGREQRKQVVVSTETIEYEKQIDGWQKKPKH